MTEEIILHHYPQSPVAEKVRVALGIKGAAWRSVEIPRIPPKPMLVKLTGGYRRTPVMQVGADVYCDSQRILAEIERRLPGPSLYPGDAGVADILGRWTEGALFDLAVRIVLGGAGAALPADFAEDRGRLYLGPDWRAGLAAAAVDQAHLAAQLRAALTWVERRLADGRAYLGGEAPGAADAQIFHVVWFLRGRWRAGPDMLSAFPLLTRWEKAVAALGHGAATEMSAEAAIEAAARAAPAAPQGVAPGDPQGLTVGAPVCVAPDVDGGEDAVAGALWSADAEAVALSREDAGCGALCVHFPRYGYRVSPGGSA